MVVLTDGTASTWAVLRFHAERQHFQPPDDVLTLRCEVVAPPLPLAHVSRRLYLAGASANQKLAQRNYRNNGEFFFTDPFDMLAITLAFCLC